ncbi:hypothetical protein ACFYXM_11600 [Streptomyces sp. NPDC002476]|uniref:hypothetical protein n=1 Tax=Streptomyces sp. NPDC002476 TaxID=3364648 RepID=UPI00367AE0EF
MAVGRSWQSLSSGERENLARQGLDAQLAGEWLALFECLSGWTSAHGQAVPRSAVHDGQPVGDWLWKQWHTHHGYRPARASCSSLWPR